MRPPLRQGCAMAGAGPRPGTYLVLERRLPRLLHLEAGRPEEVPPSQVTQVEHRHVPPGRGDHQAAPRERHRVGLVRQRRGARGLATRPARGSRVPQVKGRVPPRAQEQPGGGVVLEGRDGRLVGPQDLLRAGGDVVTPDQEVEAGAGDGTAAVASKAAGEDGALRRARTHRRRCSGRGSVGERPGREASEAGAAGPAGLTFCVKRLRVTWSPISYSRSVLSHEATSKRSPWPSGAKARDDTPSPGGEEIGLPSDILGPQTDHRRQRAHREGLAMAFVTEYSW